MARQAVMHRYVGLRRGGKHAWRRPRRLGRGRCTYCGRIRVLTHDHAIPRSLIPGRERDAEPNLVPACWPCNRGRSEGEKPQFTALPPRTREFVLEKMGAARAARYFRGVGS